MADVKAQRDRELVADKIEAMAAAIAQATPGFNAGAAALVQAVTKSAASIPEAASFATSVDAMRREVLSAADLIWWGATHRRGAHARGQHQHCVPRATH